MPIVKECVSLNGWVPSWVRCQSISRYQWVAQKLGGLDVVDAACGTGYGSRLIADAGAKSVKGFDLNAEAVANSTRDYATDRLVFAPGDVTCLPLPDQVCDAVVSFETIEHIQDELAYLVEMKRILRKGGYFFCSTPNRNLTNPGTSITDKPYNPFHIREYSPTEFTALLAKHFAFVELHGQTFYRNWYRNFLGTIGRVLPWLAVRFHQAKKVVSSPLDTIAKHAPKLVESGYPEFMIAVAHD